MTNPLLILGAGGFAREVFDWIDKDLFQVVGAYSDDAPSTAEAFRGFAPGVPIYQNFAQLRYMSYVCAVGNPQTREKLCAEAERNGLVPAMPIIHKSAIVGSRSAVHRGVIICPNVVVTCDASIGPHSILNLGCTVGHDARLDDFVTVSPGANISGNVWVQRLSYVGTNSAIREKLVVGAGSVVGMGAAVVKDLPAGSFVGGVPARDLARREITT